MALQIEYTDRTGVTVPKAYCRVEHLFLAPGRAGADASASWCVVVYRDAAARKDPSLAPITNREYRVEGEACTDLFAPAALKAAGTEPFAQAYKHVKLQAEWAGAINV